MRPHLTVAEPFDTAKASPLPGPSVESPGRTDLRRDHFGSQLDSELNIAVLAAQCAARLAESGINIDQTSEFDRALNAVNDMDKPYLTEFMSPQHNDFFEDNCFWLILYDQEGQAAGTVGSRMDRTGREPLSAYSARKLRNLFPDEAEVPVRPDRLPRIADEIQGNVVYMGDLFLGPSLRTTNRQCVRLIVLLLHCVVFLKWKDLDWVYAFLRDRDVRRGAGWLYHFPRMYPVAHSWTKPPSDHSGENWLAAMNRVEFAEMLTTYLTAPDRL